MRIHLARIPLLAGLCCLAFAQLVASVAGAQSVRADLWSTNGTVAAIAKAGDVVYIGGQFGYVGPPTGFAAAIDANTGAVLHPYTQAATSVPPYGTAGSVKAIAPDGNGGWYLGGFFTAIRGQARNGLAQLDANGNLTPWNPGATGVGAAAISALAVNGGIVFAGGEFDSIGGQARHNLAMLDAVTGAANAWNPSPASWA